MEGEAQPDNKAERPRIGEVLPAAGEAYIDPQKLVRYGLDPDHPVGRHKAAVFQVTLDIGKDDWAHLRDGILDELPRCPVTAQRTPSQVDGACTWEVLVPVTGLNGRRLYVITAWQVVAGRPVLGTLRVAPKKRQHRL